MKRTKPGSEQLLHDAFETLIDRIYEAAAIPEHWPRVLQDIGDLAGARGAILLTADPTGSRWIASPAVHDDMLAYEQGRWHEKNTRLKLAMAKQHAGFLRDIDVFSSPEDVQNDPQIREFFRPRGLGWGVGTTIPVPSGDFIVLSIDRDFDRGPVEHDVVPRLDLLRPHLARSALLTARLGIERARVATSALSVLGLPAAVLAHNGALLSGNDQISTLIPSVIFDKRKRFTLASPAADRLFETAWSRLKLDRLHGDVRSIPIAAGENHPPMILHLLPISGSAADLFVQAAALLIVTPVVPTNVPNAEVLQGLFDLTPAESRIAREIGRGRTIEEIAGAIGTSRETVRSQLKAVLGKTGVARQAELVGLLAGNTIPLNRDG